MKDMADIRRANLRKLIDEDPRIEHGNVRQWCDLYSQYLEEDERPFNPTHIRQLVPKSGKPVGSFGPTVARKIERAVGLPFGYLDHNQTANPSDSSVFDHRSEYKSESNATKSELQLRFDRSAPEIKAVVQAILGLSPLDDLPEGAGDAIRLAIKLASPRRQPG